MYREKPFNIQEIGQLKETGISHRIGKDGHIKQRTMPTQEEIERVLAEQDAKAAAEKEAERKKTEENN